jgi:hypothetical protein
MLHKYGEIVNKPRRLITLLALASIGFASLLLFAFAGGVRAASTEKNGVTFFWPDSYESCAPGPDQISLTGLPSGSEVLVRISRVFPNETTAPYVATTVPADASGMASYDLTYPPVSEWDAGPSGSMSIRFSVEFRVTVNGELFVAIGSSKWTITCAGLPDPTDTPEPDPTATPTNTPEPTPTNTPVPPAGGQGCTPGYWKQPHHFDSWVGYSPTDDFETVFGVDASFDPHTLLDGASRNGGGENALARHAVAALLNASSGGVNYAYTTADVIAMVQAAYATGNFEATKNLFEAQNDTSCPLN